MQKLERQRRECAGWRDEEMLVLDEIGSFAEEALVDRVRASGVEGQGLAGLRSLRTRNIQDIGAAQFSLFLPSGGIETAAQGGHLTL